MTEVKTERQRYLDGELTIHQYYLPIAKELGILIPEHIQSRVPGCRETSSFGSHRTLNEIPLQEWDSLAWRVYRTNHANGVFKKRGDICSLAGLVCAFKALAKEATNGE